jgi:hypothetical protein
MAWCLVEFYFPDKPTDRLQAVSVFACLGGTLEQIAPKPNVK